MLIALVLLLALACGSGYFAFKKNGPAGVQYLSKVAFFIAWTFFTVLLTLCIFKYMLKPTVEVKFNTRSWNEMMQSNKQIP